MNNLFNKAEISEKQKENSLLRMKQQEAGRKQKEKERKESREKMKREYELEKVDFFKDLKLEFEHNKTLTSPVILVRDERGNVAMNKKHYKFYWGKCDYLEQELEELFQVKESDKYNIRYDTDGLYGDTGYTYWNRKISLWLK